MDDYELFISDYKPTKAEIRREINQKIKKNRQATKTPKGLEIEVSPEWEKILNNDAAILYDYEKHGWKIMWYNRHSDGPAQGKLLRSWLSIKDKRFVTKDR